MDLINGLFDFNNAVSLTTEQSEIVKEVGAGKSVIVNAVAGSGKTTTLRETFNVIDNKFLALAFNVKIRDDLQKIVPSNGTAQTLNSLGHVLWATELNRKIVPAGNKMWQLCRENGVPTREIGKVVNLVSAAKTIGITPMTEWGGIQIIPDHDAAWLNITEDTISLEHVQWAREALISSINTAFHGWLDFNDQVYMPVVYGADTHEYETLLIDEAQDLSPLNHLLAKKVVKPNGQVVAVGDRNQSIYAFRGADANSMDNLKTQFALEEMPMNYSFRCSKEVVNAAQTIVPHIKAWKDNPTGFVEYDHEIDYENLGFGDAFLCRTNSEAATIALRLRQYGYHVNVLGKELSASIVALIKNISPTNVGVDRMMQLVQDWHSDEVRKAKFFDQVDKIDDINDKAQTIIALTQNAEDRDEVIANFRSLFKHKDDAIVVSTIHKAKGLEWKYVYLVNPDFVGKYSKGNPIKYQQEQNLKYVAMTRAIKGLYLCKI